MLNIETLSPDAIGITAIAEFRQEEVEKLVDFVQSHYDNGGGGNLLIDVTALTGFSFGAVSVELVHMPLFLRWLYTLDRIAIISDDDWIRTAARLESALLPGVVYQVYDEDEAEAARAWVLEKSDEPHKGAFREIDVGDPTIAAFEISGRLTAEESQKGVDLVRYRLEQPDCSRMMMVIRNWHGFDVDAMFNQHVMGAKLKLINEIDHYAIVGGPGWIGSLAGAMSKLLHPEIKNFDLDDQDDALEWLKEKAPLTAAVCRNCAAVPLPPLRPCLSKPLGGGGIAPARTRGSHVRPRRPWDRSRRNRAAQSAHG